jgi:glycosyltransferase involved in cell wall biosynthesis
MRKKISVIIPVYNVEKYLNKCISSVLFQLEKNIEIILIDDGSTDTSFETCEKYVKTDNRVYLVHKKNGGLSSARNIGINYATGDYLIFLDSDDFWDNKLALYNLLEIMDNDIDLICFGYREYIDGRGIINRGIDFSGFNNIECDMYQLLKEMFCYGIYTSSAWCKAIKRDLFSKHNLYFCEGIFSEDIDWSARLLVSANSIAVYCDSFYCYRQRADSIVHNLKYENLEMLANNIIKCIKIGEEIESKEFSDLYYNYVSYQYITFLRVSLLCENDSRTRTLVKEMKSYKWLLNYHLNKKVRIIYWFNKLLGFNLMLKCLKVYSKE